MVNVRYTHLFSSSFPFEMQNELRTIPASVNRGVTSSARLPFPQLAWLAVQLGSRAISSGSASRRLYLKPCRSLTVHFATAPTKVTVGNPVASCSCGPVSRPAQAALEFAGFPTVLSPVICRPADNIDRFLPTCVRAVSKDRHGCRE